MPGSSLWLLPPANHSLNTALLILINETSTHFKSQHRFLPHITLTSEISPSSYGSEPQTWLDSLNIQPSLVVPVKFKTLDSEDVFFRKLYIKCEKNDALSMLALRCRQMVQGFENEGKAGDWVEESYTPHLSLLYHDCPRIDAESLSQVEDFAGAISIDLDRPGAFGGWEGGRVVLVPTDKPIDEWKPIAERPL